MTEPTRTGETARRLDTASQLLGVVMVAAALDVGLTTLTGVALGVSGTVLATATVFIDNE